jgi:hypothetical protein
MRVRSDLIAPVRGIYGSDIIIVDERALTFDYKNFDGRHYESVQAFIEERFLTQMSFLACTSLVCCDGMLAFGKFRVSIDDGFATAQVHLDHVDWSALVYLSPHHPTGIDLSIYRHRELNLARLDLTMDLIRYGCQSRAEFDEKFIQPSASDPSAWEIVMQVEYSYNRLLLLRSGSLFHNFTGMFGSDIESGLMTHNFFMSEIRGSSDSTAAGAASTPRSLVTKS